jgi:hypothetical protein
MMILEGGMCSYGIFLKNISQRHTPKLKTSACNVYLRKLEGGRREGRREGEGKGEGKEKEKGPLLVTLWLGNDEVLQKLGGPSSTTNIQPQSTVDQWPSLSPASLCSSHGGNNNSLVYHQLL